jgi:MerR family transcriptional regulator, light-induced transcriptional regulator
MAHAGPAERPTDGRGDPRSVDRGARHGMTVAEVARHLGVTSATLRSWHRRYGLGPAAHAGGQHRAYTAVDVARLEVMRAAMLRGVPTGEAARQARAATPAPAPLAASWSPTADPAPDPVGSAERVRELRRAALALDPAAAHVVLTEAVTALGAARTWDEVARPVLTGVADGWERTGDGVEVEHMLSTSVSRAFHAAVDRAGPPRAGRPVLLAAVPGEEHHLPLGALAAVLAERGVGTRVLGPSLPEPSLRAAVHRTGPAAVFLWAQAPGPHLAELLADPPRIRPRPLWSVGGPGWVGQDLPAAVSWCGSLAEASAVVERSAAAVPRSSGVAGR